MQLYYEIVLRKHIMETHYGIILTNHITESYYEVILIKMTSGIPAESPELPGTSGDPRPWARHWDPPGTPLGPAGNPRGPLKPQKQQYLLQIPAPEAVDCYIRIL